MGNQDLLLEYFERFGHSKEAGVFLKLFKEIPPAEFALVKIGGNCLEGSLHEISGALAFLSKIGLYPVVVHGAGPQLSKHLFSLGMETRKISGLRATGMEEMLVVERVFSELNSSIVEGINSAGGKAKMIPGESVFEVVPHGKVNGKETGFVGKIVRVNPKPITIAIHEGFIPVVLPIGRIGTQSYNINADCAAKELFSSMKQKKMIFLTGAGGVRGPDGEIIQSISFGDANRLIESKIVTEGMKFKLEQILSVLSVSGHHFSVQICSPKSFLPELFSLHGAGTFIKKDSEIAAKFGYTKRNKEKIKRLLESAFQKKLKKHFFNEKPLIVLLEKDFKAVAIVKKIGGLCYLDKIAVAPEFQGEDLANSLWAELEKRFSGFFWRAAPENPVNGFYFRKCSGAQKTFGWNIYWKNLESTQSEKAMLLAIERPSDFEEKR